MSKVDRQVTGQLHLPFLRSCFLFLRICCLLQRIGKLAIPAALRLPLPDLYACVVWWCVLWRCGGVMVVQGYGGMV